MIGLKSSANILLQSRHCSDISAVSGAKCRTLVPLMTRLCSRAASAVNALRSLTSALRRVSSRSLASEAKGVKSRVGLRGGVQTDGAPQERMPVTIRRDSTL